MSFRTNHGVIKNISVIKKYMLPDELKEERKFRHYCKIIQFSSCLFCNTVSFETVIEVDNTRSLQFWTYNMRCSHLILDTTYSLNQWCLGLFQQQTRNIQVCSKNVFFWSANGNLFQHKLSQCKGLQFYFFLNVFIVYMKNINSM